MRITIVGAGALGRVYGVRLASAGDEVSFVVRAAQAEGARPLIIEQVNGGRRRDAIERPRYVQEIPEATDVVVVAVRFDQLGGLPPAPGQASAGASPSLAALLGRGPAVPVVVLTPMIPAQQAALQHAAPGPIVPAMPGISGYIDERDVVRYWGVGVASTLLDASDGLAPEQRRLIEELARRLTNADVPTRLERDVAALNAATTTAFFPLIAAIDAGGGVDGVLSSKPLLSTALDAAKECEALAHRLGKVAPWAHLLTTFVGPFTLKPAVALARRLFPETVRFVESHFGPKLHEQHLAMGRAILAMGKERGVSLPALDRLMAMLQTRGAPR